MKILAISTAEKECSIALIEDRNVILEEMWAAKQTHSKRIMGMVDRIMKRADVLIDELDGFIAAKGPGSFTGLRIGVSVVKGLSFAVAKPCVGISSLDGIAWQFSFSSYPVCVMMDAQRGEVYQAVYNFKNGMLERKSNEKAVKPTDVLRSLSEDTLFAGSGSIAYSEIIKAEFKNKAMFAPSFQNIVKSSALAEAFFQDSSVLMEKADFLVPEYLRKSDAEQAVANKK